MKDYSYSVSVMANAGDLELVESEMNMMGGGRNFREIFTVTAGTVDRREALSDCVWGVIFWRNMLE